MADNSIEKILKIFQDLVERSTKQMHSIRGPHLTKLELIKQLKAANMLDVCSTSELSLIFIFPLVVGSKPCIVVGYQL